MPISVVCPSCKARFQVSDKFAGKQGPCPKCKAPITIPTLEEQVQIHAPEEFAGGGKTTTGEAVLKPIVRQETRLQLIPAVIAVCGTIAVVAICAVAGKIFKDIFVLRAIGLWAVSVPITVAGYAFLRDDELEPHRGLWLWVRATVCALGFVGLWYAYWWIPVDFRNTTWSWFFIGPALLSLGGGIAWATFDLDFGNGFFLCCFYSAATLALGWLAGLEMPWSVVTAR